MADIDRAVPDDPLDLLERSLSREKRDRS